MNMIKYANSFAPDQTSINPFRAGTTLMLMQTGWIQASRRVTRRLAWDPTCLLLSPSFPIKNKQNLKVLKSRRQYNLFLENYPAFKGLTWHRSVNVTQINFLGISVDLKVEAGERWSRHFCRDDKGELGQIGSFLARLIGDNRPLTTIYDPLLGPVVTAEWSSNEVRDYIHSHERFYYSQLIEGFLRTSCGCRIGVCRENEWRWSGEGCFVKRLASGTTADF